MAPCLHLDKLLESQIRLAGKGGEGGGGGGLGALGQSDTEKDGVRARLRGLSACRTSRMECRIDKVKMKSR